MALWFLAQMFLLLKDAIWAIMSALHPENVFPDSPGWYTEASLLFAFAAIDGAAFWTIWKQKSSANAWGINGSGVNILLFFWQFISPARPGWHLLHFVQPAPPSWQDHGFYLRYHALYLLVGITGLFTFLRRNEDAEPEPRRGGTA